MASEGFGRALSGAVWLTAYSLLNALAGLVFWVVVAARFGPVGVGGAAAEVGLAGVAAALLNFGFLQHALREVPLRGASAFWAGFLASFLLGCGGALALVPLGGRWAPLLVPLSLSSGPVLGALVAAGSYRSAFAFQALGSLAKLLFALAGFPPLPAVFLSSLASLAFGLALAALKLGFARPRGWRGVFVVAAGNYLLNFSGGFAASLGVVLVERVAGPSEAGIFYLVAMAVLVLSSFSSSLASSSIPLMVSGGGNLAVEGARAAAGLTSLAIALASPLSPLLFPLLGRGFSPGPLALALAAPAAVEVALVSAASARCDAEGRWRELAALGLAGSLPLAALSALLPRLLPGAGSGLALPLGLLPACLLALRLVDRRALAPLPLSAAFSLLGLVLGPLSSVPFALLDLFLLHFLDVLKLGDVLVLAKAVLKSL
jgi:O-antigen/teichoic acid export membrane protein